MPERVEARAEVGARRGHPRGHGEPGGQGLCHAAVVLRRGARGDHYASSRADATATGSTGIGCTCRHSRQRRVGVLEAVTGHRAHDGQARVQPALLAGGEQARDARGRGGLDEHALGPGDQPVRLEDLLVGRGPEGAVRLFLGRRPHRSRTRASRSGWRWRSSPGPSPVRRGPAARRRRPARRACGACTRGEPVRVVLGVPAPVRGDVARVADRERVHVGRLAERVADLERRGLLALDAHRVDRVDQPDRRELGGGLAGQFEAVVEVALRPG